MFNNVHCPGAVAFMVNVFHCFLPEKRICVPNGDNVGWLIIYTCLYFQLCDSMESGKEKIVTQVKQLEEKLSQTTQSIQHLSSHVDKAHASLAASSYSRFLEQVSTFAHSYMSTAVFFQYTSWRNRSFTMQILTSVSWIFSFWLSQFLLQFSHPVSEKSPSFFFQNIIRPPSPFPRTGWRPFWKYLMK